MGFEKKNHQFPFGQKAQLVKSMGNKLAGNIQWSVNNHFNEFFSSSYLYGKLCIVWGSLGR